MGVGAARRLSSVNWGVVKEMGLTWALTFPGCGAHWLFDGTAVHVAVLRIGRRT